MIVIGFVVLAVIAILIWRRARNQAGLAERRDRLRARFGPEYDRAVKQYGSEREAISKLEDVARTRDRLGIRELTPAQRDRYVTDWMEVQAAFVDAPAAAVRDADRLVGSAMRDRGYPVDDFDAKADMVAADHPNIAENYRAAQAIRMRTDDGGDGFNTEDLRQAFVHYRALFAELLVDQGDVPTGDGQGGRHQIDLTTRDRTTMQEPPRP
jgi:hypothetical protein